jgi:O-antigen ligase
MDAVAFLIVGALAVGAVFLWFVRLERAGRRSVPVLVILGLLMVETVLFHSQTQVLPGIFHPGFGPDPDPTDRDFGNEVSFRLPDVLVVLALAARMLGRGPHLRLSAAGLVWSAFLVWLAAETVAGIATGNNLTLTTYEAKVIIYIGYFLLVAGVPATQFTTGKGLRRVIYGSAAASAVLLVTEPAGVRFDLGSFGYQVGTLGTDTATMFASLGIVSLLLGLCSERRLLLLFSAPLLLAAPFVAGQRAAYVGLVTSAALVLLLLPLRLKRIKATPTELALVGSVILALLTTGLLAQALTNPSSANVPVIGEVETAFGGEENVLSAEVRENQWSAALELVWQQPIIGWGLGKTYQHYDPGPFVYAETELTHNIGIDLLLRTGLVGLLLFVGGFVLSTVDGVRAWLRERDDLSAALALAGVAVLGGLVAKGMVESVFEKFRLAMFMGLAIGLVASVTMARLAPAWDQFSTERGLRRRGTRWT